MMVAMAYVLVLAIIALEVPLARIGAALHVEHDAARGLLVALQQQLIRK